MEEKKFCSKNILGELVYGLPFIMFICFALFKPVGIYSDTAQYIAMHIHRDPLYCLWLWALRSMTGGNEVYLNIAVWLQNLLAGAATVAFCKVIDRTFCLKVWERLAVVFLSLTPHIITPLVASSGLILSNSIMSEALTIPLFYFFTAYTLRMIFVHSRRAAGLSLVFAVLLSLTRGQMMAMIIVWLVAVCFIVISGRKKIVIGILAACLLFGAAFCVRSLAVKSYNLAFNRYFTNTTLSSVSMLSNIMYAADAEDAELIEDEETKEFFTVSYDLADEKGYNYKYCEGGLIERAMAVDEAHDRIKFDCIDEVWRPIHDTMSYKLKNDYEYETIYSDKTASAIIKAIFPACFKTWLYDYAAIALCGFIRTVAIVNPLLNIYALVVYVLLVAGTVFFIIKDRNADLLSAHGVSDKIITAPGTDMKNAYLLGLFTILTVCGNVLSTALVIMCLSRYMIYCLPLVYITLFIFLICLARIYRSHRKE